VPTYQYACTACGEQHEAVQSFTDAPLTDCPACGGRLRKVFSAVGVVFKGSGFYETDSRAGASKGSGEGVKPDGGSGDAGQGDGTKGDGTKGDGGGTAAKDAPAAAAGSGTASSTSSAKTPSTPAAKSA
jgi:putative FmdB family regulatory protein